MKICLLAAFLLSIAAQVYSISSKEFTLEYIQHTLNSSNEEENFAIAPFAAFELYKDLFESTSIYGFRPQTDSYDDPHLPKAILKHEFKNETYVEQNITMKARWTFNFQTRDTSKRPFHQLDSGDRTYLVDNLRKDDVFRYAFLSELNASVLELPLHLNEIKLLVILPQEENGLEELKDNLLENIDMVDYISKTQFSMTLVRVMLPKFSLEDEQNLMEFYDEISDQDISEYDTIQQTIKLKFKEHGIGDFEKITVLFWNAYSYLRITPEVVDISHPFLFMITNKDGIQFFGQVVKC
ncbi:ovalbumin [Musca domestica]|uniref:Ovalbumin n=2 Tax=Musca domestica TaxID=7370 RepID=A0A1I8NAA6_MUSDO|nr:ovalbumin [Musca domestica]XP_058983833.1 ovalbumin [Musca domestica]